MVKVLLPKGRPKSKAEKLTERRNKTLEEPNTEELFLDEGGQSTDNESDDEAPEEHSSKQLTLEENKGQIPEKQSKKKKRRVKKIEKGVYEVNVQDAKFKVVSLSSSGQNNSLKPKMNFKEELLALSTKKQRRTSRVHSSHQDKWIAKRL
jgi:hypothetical protein